MPMQQHVVVYDSHAHIVMESCMQLRSCRTNPLGTVSWQ